MKQVGIIRSGPAFLSHIDFGGIHCLTELLHQRADTVAAELGIFQGGKRALQLAESRLQCIVSAGNFTDVLGELFYQASMVFASIVITLL